LDIWIYDLVREVSSRLTTHPGIDSSPVWTPDGNQIAFRSNRNGPFQIFLIPADGTGEPQMMARGDYDLYPASWSSDGSILMFWESHPVTGGDIYLLDAARGGEWEPFVVTPAFEMQPSFSPDGKRVAYISNESGRYEVFVLSLDGSGDRIQISSRGGAEPTWVPEKSQLSYRADNSLLLTRYTTEPDFVPGIPEVLIELPEIFGHDFAPTGDSFVVMGRTESALAPQLNLKLNFSEELKRLAPTDK
jgi:Tol biopolymer transport system component